MQVKKKYNRGGVIKSWPPDTEVMTSDNTAVSAPQLNFLANQLLPAEVPSNIEAEMLRRQGIPAVSTQPGRPSLDYVRAGQAINQAHKQSEAQVQSLVDQGFTEEAARQHLAAYNADPLNRESDAIRSVAPVMEFLSPAGDVMAMAESIGQVLEGNVAGGLLGGGLATASVFFPGRFQGDLISDDMLRTTALQNARQGLVEEQVPDIIEYIQEVATPGQIRFGNTRSSSLGGGQRVWTEPRVGQPPSMGRGTGYMRDFVDRPYSTNPAYSHANTAPDQPYQAGRSLGHVLGESGTNVSDSSLEQVRDILNRHLSNMNRNNALNTDQIDYYQGIIDAIGLDLPPVGQTRLTSGPRPYRRTPSVQNFNDPAAVTTTRSRPASSGSGAAQAPQGKPTVEEVQLGKLGDVTVNTYTINRADPGDQPGSLITRMRTQPASQGDSNVTITLTAYRETDGLIDHDFYLNSRGARSSTKFQSRVRELEHDGLSMDAARIKATKEMDAAVNEGLRRMYGEVPVGQNIKTSSYSTDSYPLMLQGISGAKYQTIAPVDGLEAVVGNSMFENGVKMSSLNGMGANNSLFKRLKANDFGDTVDRVRAVDPNFDRQFQIEVDLFLQGKERTARNLQAANQFALTKRMFKVTEGKILGVDDALQEEVGNIFADHINEQIYKANQDGFDRIVKAYSEKYNRTLEASEIEILNGSPLTRNSWIALPRAKYDMVNDNFLVPTPRMKKIRAEKGAYLAMPKFKMKKKKGAYGMRVKK